MRKLFEFYCNDCDGWILLKLNENLRGNFLVSCPQCGRKHPRTLKENGEVVTFATEYKVAGKTKVYIDRNYKENVGEIIIPMKSAYSKKSRLDKIANKFTSELWANGVMGEQLDFKTK